MTIHCMLLLCNKQQQQQPASVAAGVLWLQVRLYTSSHVEADRFFGSALQMQVRAGHHSASLQAITPSMPRHPPVLSLCFLISEAQTTSLCFLRMQMLRYKSHLLERLHPWTRFAATSRTYGCEAETLRAKAEAHEGAAAAAATVAAAVAAAGDEGLYGGGANVPSEWEGPAASDPPGAAAELFRTEAAERTVPHLQVAYAYDEDVVSNFIPRVPAFDFYPYAHQKSNPAHVRYISIVTLG